MLSTTRRTLVCLSLVLSACGGGNGGATSAEGSEGSAPVATRTTPAEPEGEAALTAPAVDPEPASNAAMPAPTSFDVTAWASLLSTYATEDGGFRYAALLANAGDQATLRQVVEAVANASPVAYPERSAQLAFYINAYNILTVSAVVERFPIDSVMSVPGFFDTITHTVAGNPRTLNALENDLIRAQFSEPRIHFAVNCASVGCPWLDRTPFTAENLDASLTRLTRQFVGQSTSIDSRRRRVVVSQIFEWFAGDFQAAGGVRAFLVAHTDHEQTRVQVADERMRIAYTPYDWALNARP